MGSVTLFEAFPEFFQSPSVLPPKEEASMPIWEDEKTVFTQPTKRERDNIPFDSWGKIETNQSKKKVKIENNLDFLPALVAPSAPLIPVEAVNQVNQARWKMPPPRSSPPPPPPRSSPPLKTSQLANEESNLDAIGSEVEKRLYMAKVASRCSWDGLNCLRDEQCSFVVSVLQLRPPSLGRRVKRVEVIQKIEPVKTGNHTVPPPPTSPFCLPTENAVTPNSSSSPVFLQPQPDPVAFPKVNLKLEANSEESLMFTSPAARTLHLPEETAVSIPRLSLSPVSNSVCESVIEMGMDDESQWPLEAKVLHLPEESTNTDSLLATIFGISSKPTVASPFFTACQPKTSSLVRSTTPSPPSQRAPTPQSSSPPSMSSTNPDLSFASQVQGLKASQGISEASNVVNLNPSTSNLGALKTSSETHSNPGNRPGGFQAPPPSGRCGQCPGCVAAGTAGPKSTPTRRLASADCGTCRSCMDKKSNGGKGILKKACVAKQCHRQFAKPTPSLSGNTLPRTSTNIPSTVLGNVPSNMPTFPGHNASSHDLLPLLPLMGTPLTLPLAVKSSPDREMSVPPIQQHLAVSLPFPCSTCDFTFSSNNDLAKHMRNKHIDYKCNKCMGSFKGYYRMANHMKREHKGEPTLACPCGRTFSVQKGLAKHQTTCALGA